MRLVKATFEGGLADIRQVVVSVVVFLVGFDDVLRQLVGAEELQEQLDGLVVEDLRKYEFLYLPDFLEMGLFKNRLDFEMGVFVFVVILQTDEPIFRRHHEINCND